MAGSGKRHWKVAVWIVIAVAVVAAIVAAFFLWPSHADDSHLKMTAGSSTKFTTSEVNDLLEDTKQRLMGNGGCTLLTITYDEKESDKVIAQELEDEKEAPGYSSLGAAIKDHGKDRIAVADAEYTCATDQGQDGLAADNTPRLYYAYAPGAANTDPGNWLFIDADY
ncbi:MAG: hypothetical protein UHD09_08410 [Bifidobacterium sp.]|nr:hypothetical protein [Bifidobacterium sp.]